jgi:2-amino-4-hydroxy-6-hydroxymethyldihydropteridine diphosphokinase
VGGPDQPDYYNAVLLARTTLPPAGVLAAAHAAEAARQRTREVRWGPRTLDVDIISYGTVVSDDPELTLPHPRAHERAFVLVPWHDADPAAELPGHGPVAGLIARLAGPAGDGLPDGLRRAGAELRRPS